MAKTLTDRILGVETEFGCLVRGDSFETPEKAVHAIKDHIFNNMKIGLIDKHVRDEVFEPAGYGGFLINGSRLYVDAVGSHLEYSTAECRSLKDLIANDKAGQRLIIQAIKEMGLEEEVDIYNNSVDHFGGHTFGCHENYLIHMEEDFFSNHVKMLYPFLVTRQIFAGTGRVGGHLLSDSLSRPSFKDVEENPIDYIWVSQVYSVSADENIQYQLSQRSDHILKTVASRVRFNRAFINPKWEQYYSYEKMQRLHLLFGEANQSEYAYALKIGTTLLVLKLIEDGLVPPDLQLYDPVKDLKAVSRCSDFQWEVKLQNEQIVPAIEIQRRYLSLAQKQYRGESEETDWVLNEWESVLDGLESDPLKLSGKIDWVAKLMILSEYIKDHHLTWKDESLHSVDMEYHNINPQLGLYYALQDNGVMRRYINEVDIAEIGRAHV